MLVLVFALLLLTGVMIATIGYTLGEIERRLDGHDFELDALTGDKNIS